MNIINEKTRITDILKGLIIIATYLIGHMVFSPMLYIAAFLTFVLFVFDSKNIISYTIFFIPLARIMKFSPDSMTIFGVAVLFALFVILFKNKMTLGLQELMIGIIFVIALLTKNMLGEFGFPFSYIRIALLLILLPQCLYSYQKGKLNFNIQTTALMAFSGICVASIIGMVWADNAKLVEYIVSEDTYYVGSVIFNRFCGLSSDPNYFSSLVIFAIALQLFALSATKRSIYMVYAVILSSIGVLTLSKMFLLLLAVIWCFGIVAILSDKSASLKDTAKKYRVVLIVFSGVIAFCVYFINSGYYDIIVSRFGDAGASSYTTGRSDIWKEYLTRIFSSIKIIIIGASTNAETVGAHVTHNTPIQILWKMGIVGISLVVAWFISLYSKSKQMAKHLKGFNTKAVMLLLAQFLPLLALDKFFFDEFYWYYIVYLLSLMSITRPIGLYEVNK